MKNTKFLSTLLLLFIVLFSSCSDDNGLKQDSDYDYPFDYEISTSNQGVQGIAIPLFIEINETGTIPNPNQKYTLSFATSGQGILIDPEDNLYNPGQLIEVQYNGVESFMMNYLPGSFGLQTVTYTLKNSAGREVSKTINYQIEEGTFVIAVDQQNKEDYQGNEVTYNLSITENISSSQPYQIYLQNVGEQTEMKINGQTVLENTLVNTDHLSDNVISFKYNTADIYNPTIVVRNGDKTQMLSVNLNIKKYNLSLDGFLRYNRYVPLSNTTNLVDINTSQLKKAEIHESILLLSGSSVVTENPNQNIYFHVESSLNTIESVLYNGISYVPGAYFSITKDQIGEIKLKFKNQPIYGNEEIKIKVKDNFGNESAIFSKSYLLYDLPKINTSSTNLRDFYKSIIEDVNRIIKLESVTAMNITGNGKMISSIKVRLSFKRNSADFYTGEYFVFNYADLSSVNFSKNLENLNIPFGIPSANNLPTYTSKLEVVVTNNDGESSTAYFEKTEVAVVPLG